MLPISFEEWDKTEPLKRVVLADPDNVGPQRLPLALLSPDVGPLGQRHNKPLRLHEHHLWRADLSFHRVVSSFMGQGNRSQRTSAAEKHKRFSAGRTPPSPRCP